MLATCVVNVLRGGNIDVCVLCIHTVETLLQIIKLYNMFFTNRILGTLQQQEKKSIYCFVSEQARLSSIL